MDILTAIAILLAVAAFFTLFVIVRAVRDIRMSVTEVRQRLVPLLEKADVTLDAINAELLRVDAIVTQAEGVGDAVSSASDFIRSPVEKAARGMARLVRAFRRRRA